MTKGSAWGVLGLASIIACLHASPARAIWTATETSPACAAAAPAAPAPAATEGSAVSMGPSAAEPLAEMAPVAQPEDGEVATVEIVDEPPSPEVLTAAGRTCCFYKSGFSPDPVLCRERTCVPIGQQCPLELHGCPFWTSFTVNSCGACR